MKKITILMIAFVAMLVVGGTAVASDQTEKFESDISVKYKGGDDPYYASPVFKGSVKSDKGACEKNRKVKVKSLDGLGTVGSDQTNDAGRYEIDASGFGPGDYKAKAVKKVIDKKHGEVICKSAKAEITVK